MRTLFIVAIVIMSIVTVSYAALLWMAHDANKDICKALAEMHATLPEHCK